jgi:hypothetical protein
MLLNISAYRLHRFGRAMAPDRSGPAAQASTITSFLSLIGLGEKSNVSAAGTARGAGWPAINTGRRHREDKLPVLRGIAGQNRLPAQVVSPFVVFLLGLLVVVLFSGSHLHRFRQIEYRIGCHNVVSLGRRFPVDHPDLAVKATFLRYAGGSETQDSGRFSVPSTPHSAMSMSKDGLPITIPSETVATYIDHELRLDASHFGESWQKASAVVFSSDWQGKDGDPGRETDVRALWSREYLYLRFECRYRELFVFEDSDPNGRRDHLWDRDVAEVFLQPDPSRAGFYREFEVSPNGMWVDLDIFPGGRTDLKSGLQRSVAVNEKSHTWTAELAIPMKSLVKNFDPSATWRANFYRVEGKTEPRAYLAWRPTNTPQPNFHVQSAFGALRFAGAH